MSEIDIYMGIDCGLDGAIVCLSTEGDCRHDRNAYEKTGWQKID